MIPSLLTNKLTNKLKRFTNQKEKRTINLESNINKLRHSLINFD